MDDSRAVPVLLVLILVYLALIITALGLFKRELYWGSAFSGRLVPISSRSRSFLALAAWLFPALLVANGLEFPWTRWIGAAFFISAVAVFASGMADTHRYRMGPADRIAAPEDGQEPPSSG